MRALAAGFALIVSLALAEAACRLFYSIELKAHWKGLMEREAHYYRASANPVLVYELRPNYRFEWLGRSLQTNRYGIRDANNDRARRKRRVGLVGDSAVFGIWQTQVDTISHQAQRLLDPGQERFKLLNLGVPGYGIQEIAEQLRVKDAIYALDEAIYMLNLNDFARRDSVYEGGDNSLYRMYRRPSWWSRYVLRKAIYRIRKHGGLGESNKTSPDWYRWLFEGNREFAERHMRAMAAYTKRRGIRFHVVVLPAGAAFTPSGQYQLADLHREIGALLQAVGLGSTDSTAVFAEDPGSLINETEHPSVLGNRKLAELIADRVDGGNTSGPADHGTEVAERAQ